MRRVSYVVAKFQELWSRNGSKPDRRFYLPSLFCFVTVHAHPLCGINVAPHSDSRWNGIGVICSSDLRPQKLSWKCCDVASGGLKWQYIAIIATFSSYYYYSFNSWHLDYWRLLHYEGQQTDLIGRFICRHNVFSPKDVSFGCLVDITSHVWSQIPQNSQKACIGVFKQNR